MSVFASELFSTRHIGPTEADIAKMLKTLGMDSLDALLAAVVPASIRSSEPLATPAALSEPESLARLREIAGQNQVWRSYIGCGYHNTHTPAAILRNLLENPGWYTAYTPYQAEISQGRLEALLNFQTMVSELTGFDCANASLLDEATAAAEAMTMSRRVLKKRKTAKTYFVDKGCHPQTIAVIQTRAEPLGFQVIVGDTATYDFSAETFGVLVQVPATDGTVTDHSDFIARAHDHGAIATISVDPLAMMLIKSPADCGADIAIGSSQRFGVPMGYGGPHAAFMATDSKWVRNIPGRIIGVSVDTDGNPALRMALQTREQHIRRERATSNICTAQVLLAVIAGMYAVYHGPKGLTAIAERVRAGANALKLSLTNAGYTAGPASPFDTVWVEPGEKRQSILVAANAKEINLRHLDDGRLAISLDETVTLVDIRDLFEIFGSSDTLDGLTVPPLPAPLKRAKSPLQHPVFSRYHDETSLMRYLRKLQGKDLALDTAMIPLGSCTMKLNAAAEMIPITWPEFGAIHPFVPRAQAHGYTILVNELEAWLAEITGFDRVTFQPNAGSQGEYTGLLLIRAYHRSRNEAHRNICLIPRSAHGTNPASAVMAGMKVIVVKCHENGDIDIADLTEKADTHADNLAAIMVTYPSTHGVFEETIRELCEIVHDRGGQVYLDGANMNAMVGLCKPGKFGADVAHLNLHKTFSIPHGGGGPGVGPACLRSHLAPFLPSNPMTAVGGEASIGAISAAPFGSTSILPIPWAYIAMLGPEGLKSASAIAILSANYISKSLQDDYTTLYKGSSGFVAHECILDLNPLKVHGVTAEDVAKRLMDYGFHAPTLSFPVVGTLMVEPTESEPMYEIDRFIEAMRLIRTEIRAIESGDSHATDNALKNSPHTATCVMSDWDHAYTRESAVFPTAHTRDAKYWPTIRRVDNVHGDKNLVCSCPDISNYE